MKAVVKVDIVDGKCVVIYSDGSEQELYDVSDDTGGSGEAVLGTKNITSNGSYTARNDGYDGYSSVNVNVPTGSADLGTKNIVANGTYNASSDNLDGYSSVNVNVPTGITPTGTKQIAISENGTTTEDVTNYANAQITVNVQGGGSASIDSFVDGTVPVGATTLPTATTIIDFGLAKRLNMTSLSAPNVTNVGGNALSDCTGLTSVSFPSLTQFTGTYTFSGCTQISSIAFPSLTNQIQVRTFNNCSSLTIADLGNCTKISTQAFNGTSALRTLVLRKADAICTLDAWNAYTLGGICNNPTMSTIYVPQSLLSAYKEANNWMTGFNAGLTFTAIEGSYYETHYGDGTPIT